MGKVQTLLPGLVHLPVEVRPGDTVFFARPKPNLRELEARMARIREELRDLDEAHEAAGKSR